MLSDCFVLKLTSYKTTGAAGFRLDAIKHIDRRFLLQFVGATYVRYQHYRHLTRFRKPGEIQRMTCSSFQNIGREGPFIAVMVLAQLTSNSLNTVLPYIRVFRGHVWTIPPSDVLCLEVLINDCRPPFLMYLYITISTSRAKLDQSTTYALY
jgi:hypothetical protein